MDTVKVLALDGGESVGWYVGEMHQNKYRPLLADVVWTSDKATMIQTTTVLEPQEHGITEMSQMAKAVYKAVVIEDKYDVVVLENWKLAPAKAKYLSGSDIPTVQFNGMVKLCCWLNPRVELVVQDTNILATIDKVLPRVYPDLQAIIDAAPKSHNKSHDMFALRHLAKWHYDRYVG